MIRAVPRAGELGIKIGIMPSGPTSSIIDVPGIGVGHATVWRDEPAPPEGRGVARTGVSVLDLGGDLFHNPVPAGGAILNGAGECTGFIAAGEWGLAETPVFLTSTMQLGRVYDAACELLIREQPDIGVDDVVIPIVAECDDSFLSDARRMQVGKDDVAAALRGARESIGRGPPAEGSIGAGTGMSCFDFKGGIGSASRVASTGHTVGVLVMANFGEQERLTVDGVPVGRALPPLGSDWWTEREREGPGQLAPAGAAGKALRTNTAGSCIVVAVTDAPLDSAACTRLARRAGLGLARTGSTADHGSGEIFMAMATGARGSRDGHARVRPELLSGAILSEFFAAVVEATEEAVLNSLLAASTVVGRDGNTSYGLPAERVVELLRDAGRL
jgi:D-aminopeptidase